MLFGHDMLRETAMEDIDLNPFVEAFIVDDLTRAGAEKIKEFAESPLAEVLEEKAVLKKNTMMRLSKQDDLNRRIKLCAYQLAKEDNDPNWKKMIFHRAKWREYRDLVMKKYGKRAAKVAASTQKEYIKTMAKAPASGPAEKPASK